MGFADVAPEMQQSPLSPDITAALARRSHQVSQLCSAGVAVLGAAVLAGWLFDIPTLKSLHSSFVTMKANAAFLFVLLGTAVWLAGRDPRSRLATVCGLMVVLFGALTVAQDVFGTELGIDQILFRDSSTSFRTRKPTAATR